MKTFKQFMTEVYDPEVQGRSPKKEKVEELVLIDVNQNQKNVE